MKSIRTAAPLLSIFLVAPAVFAQQPRLVVAEKGQQSLAIIDPVAGKVLATVPEGGITGHEVIASPDGKLAYVPIYGNSGVGKPGTDGSTIVVIDIAARKVSPPVAPSRTRRSSALPAHSVPKTACSTSPPSSTTPSPSSIPTH